ncbi:hypothetical protein KTH_47730 [Thermosporothrix hazakensis]|nr:hypothetical protein KTH_47730 [Thermosporothrix hazakensis]
MQEGFDRWREACAFPDRILLDVAGAPDEGCTERWKTAFKGIEGGPSQFHRAQFFWRGHGECLL